MTTRLQSYTWTGWFDDRQPLEMISLLGFQPKVCPILIFCINVEDCITLQNKILRQTDYWQFPFKIQ